MPRKKLTLSVDEDVIRKAKRYSRRNDTSISRLVTEFLSLLSDEEGFESPVVSRLRGVLASEVSVDEYRDHLVEKHGR